MGKKMVLWKKKTMVLYLKLQNFDLLWKNYGTMENYKTKPKTIWYDSKL